MAFALIGVIGNYQQCVRWIISICVISAFASICYYIVLRYDLISKFDSAEKVQAFLSKYGAYAGIIFVFVQFLQVTIIPLPAAITTLAGVALFGFWPTFFYSVIGTLIGSMLAFYLGRKFGVKLIIWLFGKNAYDKYVKFTQGKDKIVLTLMFLFPFFPDDLLCIVAGITDMKYWQFFVLMLITRPLNTLILEGSLKGFAAIPLTGYGIPIWIAIIAVALVAVVLAFKYSNKLENALMSLFDKISSKIKKRDKAEIKDVYSKSKSCYDKNNIIK
ncbi:MAG: TVP38/TMEM64 family protein [Clostridia bacterium]|nr:TVP38/TMEM64 family protein [Clostridia bacterium]